MSWGAHMLIDDRLCVLRESTKLSQGEIEKRSGLLRCYISRVESGHTILAVETLEKLARALEVPLYRRFCDEEQPSKAPELPKLVKRDGQLWGATGKDAGRSDSSAGFSAKPAKATKSFSCRWRRRWRTGQRRRSPRIFQPDEVGRAVLNELL